MKKIFFLILAVFLVLAGFLTYYNVKFIPKPVVLQGSIFTASINRAELSDEELKNQIGQMIMIGFRGTDISQDKIIHKIISDVGVGGVVLFDYDSETKTYGRNITSFEQTKNLISQLQSYSKTPLFIAVDAEGGAVNRLSQKYGFVKIDSAQKMGFDKTLQATFKNSKNLALQLKKLGFNMDFAPVVDVNMNPKNPIIGALGRSFSADAVEVSQHAEIFMQNLHEKDIIAVAKHFPGQGSATEDSHTGVVDITDVYKEEELSPYRHLNEAGILKAVMSAHVINKNVDAKNPASLSFAFLQNILRSQLQFKGLIISDDLQMNAILKSYSLEEALINAVIAGNDVLTVLNNGAAGYDENLAYKARNIIFDAVKTGKITKERITESYERIMSAKKEFGIIVGSDQEKKERILNKKIEFLSLDRPMAFGEAVQIAVNVQKHTGIRPAFLLGVLQQELKLEKYDLCYLNNFKTGSGYRISDNKNMDRVMHVTRDIPAFLKITTQLRLDPEKTPVTCPMEFGFGGAIGPADFIPSTWLKYAERVEKITGENSNPWNFGDAALAAGIFLSESSENKNSREDGEWASAMTYFSGSATSPHTWYANEALDIAAGIQSDIDLTSD